MDHGGFSGAMLDWKCPNRTRGSDIPLDVYQEIFAWLRLAADPDTDRNFYNTTLARLALVCRYFSHYATFEMWRCLNFYGGHNQKLFLMPAEAWCTGVTTWLQPVEMLRTHVRECALQYWQSPDLTRRQVWRRDFTQFIPMLSHLDNLAVLTLDFVPMSHALLQSIGRLKRLEELIILSMCMSKFPGSLTDEPCFALQETPFPVLRRLEVHYIESRVDSVFQDALRILASVPSLRTLVVGDSRWLDRFLPIITPQLVSFSGNLTRVPPEAFLRFIKGHAALQNLTVYFTSSESQGSYLGINLDPTDLPNLRAFSGPFALAPKVIGSRPVTKLASPCHTLFDFEPAALLPFMGVSKICCVSNLIHYSWDVVNDDPEVWRALKPIGGGISQLVMHVSDANETLLSQISLSFPNLVHLQLEVPSVNGNDLSHKLSWNVSQALLRFKSLKSLMLASQSEPDAACWISPGEQHHFVHSIYQWSCPTLKTVIFGPLMVWHLGAVPTGAGDCH
ncbi:hypothetical protein JB92DRAFT_2825956 [Gautieria morchelliformis]|nr:hypothetical protein JB92DRAFT_2825956 [Gautieria morchelliformis]